MGYRGKLVEQERARALRAEGYKLAEIAQMLGVAKSSVSLWVRDVTFTPRDPRYGRWRLNRPPTRAMSRKQEEIARLYRRGPDDWRALERPRPPYRRRCPLRRGRCEADGFVGFANTNPQMIRLFCAWLRRFFSVDESRLRVRLYLHQGLDLETAITFWSDVTGIARVAVRQALPSCSGSVDPNRKHVRWVRNSPIPLLQDAPDDDGPRCGVAIL